MPDFPVIDAHVHFIAPGRLSYPWLATVPAIDAPHGPTQYRAATGRTVVDRLLFVEVDARPEDRFAEMAYVAELRAEEPRLAGVVASALLERGAAAAEEIERLRALGRLKGIRRQIQNRSEPGWCLAAPFLEGVRMLARYDLPFDICIKHHQLAEATELVRRCPEVTFVLDHIAKPPIAAGGLEPWATGLRAMAALPNVVCKMTGVTTEADHASWRHEDVRPYIDHAFTCFGTERMLFCSDWPVINLSDSFEGWVATLDRVLEGVSAEARRAFYRDNAIRTYRLEV
ncbi:amidohydrolase family protein [Ancylobacter lacus]|uniref:amidohydrolase family protein n=1 Tax=Ancylobacter lacus TaxID=2579970 RepID=UPI001BD0EAA2|nr:amidohydrolase family protein [Ancylobacter lacus]MBS7540340.1 amidohydrolase family protein [Ancylobacter lacus]